MIIFSQTVKNNSKQRTKKALDLKLFYFPNKYYLMTNENLSFISLVINRSSSVINRSA